MKTVKRVDASSADKPLQTDWQVLGELELPVGPECAEVTTTWLKENLSPLNLRMDLIHRILKSAQAAVVRAGESSVAAIETGHIHLVIFAPRFHETEGKTWGFFRIEKLESARQEKNTPDHSIEFYLYIEGN